VTEQKKDMFAGIADTQQAQALRDHLANPNTFGAPTPLPSVSLDSGRYSKDMWRGPMWINMNYLTVRGLRRYGFNTEAEHLKELSLQAVQRWYEEEGCLFEFYDSLGITSPRGLDRKQRLSTGQGMAPISDYHWTAALTAALLLE
jgi:neutral trehalase